MVSFDHAWKARCCSHLSGRTLDSTSTHHHQVELQGRGLSMPCTVAAAQVPALPAPVVRPHYTEHPRAVQTPVASARPTALAALPQLPAQPRGALVPRVCAVPLNILVECHYASCVSFCCAGSQRSKRIAEPAAEVAPAKRPRVETLTQVRIAQHSSLFRHSLKEVLRHACLHECCEVAAWSPTGG